MRVERHALSTWHTPSLTVWTLIGGNRFWNRTTASFKCSAPDENCDKPQADAEEGLIQLYKP